MHGLRQRRLRRTRGLNGGPADGIGRGGNLAAITLTGLENSLVASNSGGGEVFGTISGDHNLIGLDPRLGPLADNGGPTLTMALLPDSPAIDAGISVPGVDTDQRGVARPQGPAPDLGAFEVALPKTPPTILVNDGHFGFNSETFGFNVSGSAGAVVVIEGSTNLVDWSALATNTLGSGPCYFRDPASAGQPWRFYRARGR